MDSPSETRDNVLHVPNLFDFFCQRTAQDMRERSGSLGEPPVSSFAGLLVTALLALALLVFGKPALARAVMAVFGLMLVWTVWGVVIRASEQIGQKAENIRAGVFPPASAPYVLARLKSWNHLITPRKWGRFTRLHDRRMKLERKVAGLEAQLREAGGNPPSDDDVQALADKIHTFSDRNTYELRAAVQTDPAERIRAELLLARALVAKIDGMTAKLDRIGKLAVTFQDVSPDDLSQVVNEALQILDERRVLVLNVDRVDPERFVDLVTVRAG